MAQRAKCPASRRAVTLVAGQPLVEVVLAAGGQGQVVGGEPFQQRAGGADVSAYDGDLLVGGVCGAVAAAQAP
jgi:hypothetical protein